VRSRKSQFAKHGPEFKTLVARLALSGCFLCVKEIVVGSNMDKIYIVMDYVEHDLKSLMEIMKEPFSIGLFRLFPRICIYHVM